MLSPLPKWPSNLDLVEARLLQYGPSGPEIDRPDPSLPAEPRKPATAADTKLDPETIGFDPSFGEYDADGHSSLDKYLSGSLLGNFMKWITSELWPQLEKYLGKGYDKLILQNLPPDRINAHRDGQSSESEPAAAMTPAEKANSEGLSYDQQVFLGTNLPNENGQQLSADNTLLLKDFASFREGLQAKTPKEIGVMHDQITKHLESLVAFVDKPEEEEQDSLAYVQSKSDFYKDLKAGIDAGDIGSQAVLANRLEAFNDANGITPLLTEQGKTLQAIIDAKNADDTAPLGNKSALLLANYWLEQDFLLLKTLVPENAEPKKLSAEGTLQELIAADYTDPAFNQFLKRNYERLLAIVDKDSSVTDLGKNKAYIEQLSALIYNELSKYPLPSEADFGESIAGLRKNEPQLGEEFKVIVDVISRGAKLKLVKKIPEQEKAEKVALAEKEKVILADLINGKLEIPPSGQSWDPSGGDKLLRRSQDLFVYRHELHRGITGNDKNIDSSYLLANELITGAEYQKLSEINSDVIKLVRDIQDGDFGIPKASSPLLNKYRNEVANKLASSTQPLSDKRVQAYYEQVLNYLDYAQAYVDRQPRVLFGKVDLAKINDGESKVINITSIESPFLYIDNLGNSKSGELNIKQNDFELTLDGKKYNVSVVLRDGDKIGPINLIVEKGRNGLVRYYLGFPNNNRDYISKNAFLLNEFIRVNGEVIKVADDYKVNFGNYAITSGEEDAKNGDVPAGSQSEAKEAPKFTQAELDELIDILDGENFDLQVGFKNHDIEIRNVKKTEGKLTFDFFVDDGTELVFDRKLATGTIEKQNNANNYSLILGTLDGDISKKLDISKSKDQLIQSMSQWVNYVQELLFCDQGSWLKAENFDNNSVITGGGDDNFSSLTFDSTKKIWTVNLKSGGKIPVTIEQNINTEGAVTEMLLVANKNDKPVVGSVPWPDDVYDIIDRTDVLKQAANRLVNVYLAP